MERKREFRASTSPKAEGTSSESGIDRFSVLPEEVAHCILSLLNFKDLTRVGALPKRCRQFHLSVPVVDFGTVWWTDENKIVDLATLMISFDRYLHFRGHNRLQQVRIGLGFYASDEAKKGSALRNAIRCNVEELDVHFSQLATNKLSLPSSVFHSQSLRSLSVSLGLFDSETVEATSLSFSSNLRYLSLRYVNTVCEGGCFQMDLMLLQMRQGVTSLFYQKAPSETGVNIFNNLPVDVAHHILSFLDFNDITRVGAVSRKCRLFYLSAPVVDYHTRLLSSLDRYLIYCGDNRMQCLRISWRFCTPHTYCDQFCDDQFRVLTWIQNAVRCYVEELDLHFENIRPPLPSCIFRAQSLRSLSSTGFGLDYWKMQNLSFVGQLKEVTREHSHGSNEIEFERYILEHAQNLKKMVIALYNDDAQSQVVAEMVSRSKTIPTARVCTSVLKVPV
ncbi:unnamed protein product [Malus baccata var. baccata]